MSEQTLAGRLGGEERRAPRRTGWLEASVALRSLLGQASLGLASAGVVALLLAFVPPTLKDDGNSGPVNLGQQLAWLAAVSGLTSWIPICTLVAARIYARSGWTMAIPLVGVFAAACSLMVTWQALRVCSPWMGGSCW